MNMSGGRLAIVIVLAILGLYFLVFHMNPLPLNHEAIGLGNNHIAHAIFGIVLLVGAGLVWWKSRTVTTSTPKPSA